jgi:hypothetical protein
MRKKVGIILLVLGAMAFFGGFINGSWANSWAIIVRSEGNIMDVISAMTTVIIVISLLAIGALLLAKEKK